MATSAASTSSKIIKFEDGIPITVIMDGKRGIAGEARANQWGTEEWMHWVNGDANIIYLPGAAQKQLELSGAQFRDWVSIEKVRGGKNQIWRVSVEEPHSDRAELGRMNYLQQKQVSEIRRTLSGSEAPPPPATHAERQQAELAGYISSQANPSRQDGTLAMPTPPRNKSPWPSEEEPAPARRRAAAAAAAPPTPDPQPIGPAATQIPISAAAVLMDMSRPEAKQMASALFCAIDAFAVAQAYAHQKSLMVSFTSEDVRAFAITSFIGAQKGGRA